MGGSAPRILALDDYFMVETEKEDKDPETGRKVITKVIMWFSASSNMNDIV
jgi:YLP motif-containing protein 1